ncbi:MAG: CPBP family intramembrane metalloprotease [Cyclobacteriaceae bacterium]|nr:CPBP family intramembrane metalloprotease [Cyclobacteriaceae bacterium]
MKKLWQYLRQHIQQDFNLGEYASIAVFLTICIIFNYKYDFEDSFLDQQSGVTKFAFYALTHAVAYFIPVLLIQLFANKKLNLTRDFWVRALFLVAVISFDRSGLFVEPWALNNTHYEISYLAYKIAHNLAGILYIILPVFLFYLIYEKPRNGFYGLASKTPDIKPYIMLLLIMLPIIVMASFLPGFQQQYPMYKVTTAHEFLGVPEWVTVLSYELAYASNFISVEFFYRGFLVIGMAAALGRSAILPMASLYCFLHFGKPMPEAVSSIFGGYILGVIALETRSIWGGIFVHVGIAWLMEIAAFMQSVVRNYQH